MLHVALPCYGLLTPGGLRSPDMRASASTAPASLRRTGLRPAPNPGDPPKSCSPLISERLSPRSIGASLALLLSFRRIPLDCGLTYADRIRKVRFRLWRPRSSPLLLDHCYPCKAPILSFYTCYWLERPALSLIIPDISVRMNIHRSCRVAGALAKRT